MGRTKTDYKRNSTSKTNKSDKARPRPKFQNGGSATNSNRNPSSSEEVPSFSKEGVAVTFECRDGRFQLWLQALRIRYWVDCGYKEEYNVKWKSTRNGKSSKNQITQQLINISRVDDGEISSQ